MSTQAETRRSPSLTAPLSGFKRLFVDWTMVGGSTAVCHALGAATSLLLRMLLSPAQMGVFSAVKMFLSYGNYANLGISKGAVREFNVATGGGDTRAARRGLRLAFTVNTISSAIYGCLLCGLGVWMAYEGGDWANAWAVGLIVVGVMAVIGRYVSFHVTILRADQRFAVTSTLSILEATLTLGFCGLATWLWGLPGLFFGTLAVMLCSMWFVRRHAAATLGWAFDGGEIRRLIAIGGPILLAGAGSSLFRSLDKLMILAYMDDCEFQLGCYSTALLVTGQLYGLANMLATVTGPRYGQTYGNSGSRREAARLAAQCSELQAAAMVLPAAISLLIGPPILGWLLPDYGSGLSSLTWLVPGFLALMLALPCGQYMIAVGRQRRALAAVLLGTLIGAAGNHIALSAGWGLSGVAAATAVGYASYFAFSAGMSFLVDLSATGRARYVLMHAIALTPTMATAMLLRATTSLPVAICGVLLAWSATLLIGWHYGGWRTRK